MSKIFAKGTVRCTNASCPDFLRLRHLKDISGDEWLRRGICPSCHRKVRHKSKARTKVRYIETNQGETKRVEEIDSTPLCMVKR